MFEGGKWAWYMHPGQLLQYMEQHITISEMTLNGGGAANGNVDIVQQRKALAKIHGIPVIQSIHASRTDVDLINAGRSGADKTKVAFINKFLQK
jgi:hypothetical protein